MFERIELKTLKKRIKEPRKFIQVIMGPRQVGKTTMVHQLLEQIETPGYYASADAVVAGNISWLEQIWETSRFKMKSQSAEEFIVVIDEIQKITNWSETVKKLWDEDTKGQLQLKVILLGSSRLLVQQGLTESLAGRFETIYLTHWTFKEMNMAFGWNAATFAWFGGYPGSVDLANDESRWKKYIRDAMIETSISKDIIMLTRIDKPALLRNLFDVGCMYSGQILSLTKILGQLQDAGNTTTLSHYLKLLETSGLLMGMEKYAGTVLRKRGSSPKFQVYNNALLAAQHTSGFKEVQAQPAEWGRIVESAIGAHLVNQSVRQGFKVFYWRDRNEEVDFVLEKQAKIIAIEVKSGFSGNTKGIMTFSRLFHPQKIYLVDNNGIPWPEFLEIDPVELF